MGAATRKIVGISGNLTRPSKTRTLVGEILRQAEVGGLGTVELFDIVDAGPELGAAVYRNQLAAGPDRVVSAIEQADALIVATPVYKAAYTGLFKHLFDLIDPKFLESRPVIVAATGGSDRHALVIEHHLLPLFAFFRTAVVPTTLYMTNTDFDAEGGLSPMAIKRIGPAIDQLKVWLDRLGKSGSSAEDAGAGT